jgi:putative ubiquitin-RnfH superfamily antitoxin RatB of RatAB toxin-antitoxin module
MSVEPRHAEPFDQPKHSESADRLQPAQIEVGGAACVSISVVWASPAKIESVSLVLPVGTQVQQALDLSGLLQKYQPTGLAIFGQRCDPTRLLSDGDRVELCRPLVVEPKAARRRRALHREKVRNIKKKMPIDDLTV